MSSLDLVVNFFKQGGVFLYPIAAVFAIGLAIAAERFIYLTRVAAGNRRLWAELAPLLPRDGAELGFDLFQEGIGGHVVPFPRAVSG